MDIRNTHKNEQIIDILFGIPNLLLVEFSYRPRNRLPPASTTDLHVADFFLRMRTENRLSLDQ